MHPSARLFAGSVFLLGVMLVSGCVTPGTKAEVTSGQAAPSIDQAQAEAYDGPKARIAVAQFKDKTGKGWWTGQIGDGMADQLVTALFNSQRFIVLDRQTLDLADLRAPANDGIKMEINSAIIAMTTSSSMSVNPRSLRDVMVFHSPSN